MAKGNLIVVTPWQRDGEALQQVSVLTKQTGLRSFEAVVIPLSPTTSDSWVENLEKLKKLSDRVLVLLPPYPVLMKAIASGIPHLVIDPADGKVKKLVGVKPILEPFNATEFQ
jgi:MinD-like ATPase involved in chromosome partitioning or flagellar assembly